MFCIIPDLPPFAIGIEMKGEVTKEDFETVLIPAVKDALKLWKALNLLIVLETELKNFTAGAWAKDILTNLRYYWSWNKIAVVTASESLGRIFSSFDLVIPGDVKSFSEQERTKAIEWISLP